MRLRLTPTPRMTSEDTISIIETPSGISALPSSPVMSRYEYTKLVTLVAEYVQLNYNDGTRDSVELAQEIIREGRIEEICGEPYYIVRKTFDPIECRVVDVHMDVSKMTIYDW